jgi:uncharacterized protein (DUF1499 family)
MKKLLFIAIAVAIIVIIAFIILSFISKKGQALGLKNGQLQTCLSPKNCVISETIDGASPTVEPLAFTIDKATFLAKAKTAVQSIGGTIITSDENYIAATFSSAVFGFIDDLELRICDDNLLHFRSSSRVGRSDLGANKYRIDELKLLLL